MYAIKDSFSGGKFLLMIVFFSVCLVLLNSTAVAACDKEAHPESCLDKKPYLVKEYDIDGMATLNVFTPAGDIELITSPDPQKVRVELYVDQGFSFWPLGNNLEQYRITNFKKSNEITSSVEKKSKEQTSFWGGQTTFSYKIYVPAYISTILKTLDGSISVEHINGKQLLKSNGGNITLRDVKGFIQAYAAGGNIMVDDSKGRLFIQTDGGDIAVHKSMGEMRFKTNGGEISSTEISGSMVARVNGGNIDVEFKKVGQGINLEANAGNIHLMVPGSSGYQLFAKANKIRFDETRIFKGTYSKTLADGTINGGGVPINLRASAGIVTFQLKQ